MGGDHGPHVTVPAALEFQARASDVDIVLVGVRDAIEAELVARGAGAGARLRVHAAAEVVAMDEPPAQALRYKKDSSMRVAVNLVKHGAAHAAVSAGNTGALMAISRFVLKTIPGIDRPAIGSAIPTSTGRNCFLLDVGANTDARPEHLLQYAVMGSIYAEKLMGIATPRVALLSNGEESGKGNQLVQAAEPLLRAQKDLNFVGNVEGKDVFRGKADVVVADGLSGNILVKTAEGVAEFLFQAMRDAVAGDPLASLGGLLIRPKLRAVRRRADWREFGGALLLGVNGVAVIAHGRSDARAIYNAIRVARDAVQREVVATFTAAVPSTAPRPQKSTPKTAPFVT